MAETSGFDLKLKVRTCFDAICLMSLIGFACLNEEDGPGGMPSHETHLEWWQNPTNVMKGEDFYPQDHSIQIFTDTSNEGWDAHLEQTFTKVLWSAKKGLYIMF